MRGGGVAAKNYGGAWCSVFEHVPYFLLDFDSCYCFDWSGKYGVILSEILMAGIVLVMIIYDIKVVKYCFDNV